MLVHTSELHSAAVKFVAVFGDDCRSLITEILGLKRGLGHVMGDIHVKS